MPLVFFTIAARNYLAYVLTLMQALAAQHPEARRYLCLADTRADDPALATDLFDTVTVAELGLPHFEAFVFRYDLVELNTAVKPSMFAWLRERHPEAGLVYLDPDLLVLRQLDAVTAAFAAGRLLVLTPHLTAPLPDDRHFPDELALMRTGAYNCGFVALNAAHPQAAALLDWWARKLEFDGRVDLDAGLFTDQKWMDLVPGLFPDVAILRDDGYNVAYWNLANRTVAAGPEGRFTVNGVPLVCVHFSGLDWQRPEVFSRYQDRFTAATLGGLRPLYEVYRERLRANGHDRQRDAAYAYDHFADGSPILPVLRRTYRRCFDVRCAMPELEPRRMQRARFNAPCRDVPPLPGLPVSEVMYDAWLLRADLRSAYTLQTDAGRYGFIQWYLAFATIELGLADEYVAPLRAQFTARSSGGAGVAAQASRAALRVLAWGQRHRGLARWYARAPGRLRLALRRRLHAAAAEPMPPLPLGTRPARGRHLRIPATADPDGVNLIGYARGEFGIAENVRACARALARVGAPFVICNLDVGVASRQDDHSLERCFSDTLRYATNVFFVNADQLPVVRGVLGHGAFAGRRNVGYFLWELEHFPAAWRGAFALVDEVWVPTEFVRAAIAAATTRPVRRLPKAIEFEPSVGLDRAYFGLPPDACIFLFSFDFNSFVARKNPQAAIAAFRQAFAATVPGVRLLVKSINGERHPEALAELQRVAAGDARIEVRDGFLTRAEMYGLLGCADCHVSLHRSEGFGLGLAESMYLGKPVIATGYSGNLDFMDRDNSLLVDYRLVPVAAGAYPHAVGQHWADPDVAQAARHMRRVFEDRAFARQLGAVAAASIRRSHSQLACGQALAAQLQALNARRVPA